MSTRSTTVPVAALLIAVGFLVGAAVDRRPTARFEPQDSQASRPTTRPSGPLLVVTGNEKGFIRPCGCSKPALGGVHRRAHALEELRSSEPELVCVSVGNLIVEGGRQQQIKFESFLLSLREMRYAALVPGPGEIGLGARVLAECAALADFPFVLANAVIPDVPLIPSLRLAKTGMVLIGLVPPQAVETGAVTSPAPAALARELAANADAKWIIVVWNGEAEDLGPIAGAVPAAFRSRVIFVIPGHADAPEMAKAVLEMPVIEAGSKGRNLGFLRPGAAPLLSRLRLEEERPGLPSVAAILENYRSNVKDEDLYRKIGRSPAVAKYAGDASCKECHEEACAVALRTPHQHAFADLEKTNDQFDPECVKCHVTGWAVDGGYVDPEKTPTHRNVNCEACHGPGAVHIETAGPTPGGKVNAVTCQRCHDADNSPQFDFKTYWPKIEHK